jgi:hypothetical protein
MKDIFWGIALTPARAIDDTKTRREVITPDGGRGDDDNKHELSKLIPI